MKNKDKREYKKALNLYNNGYIDKAIEICEIGISRNLEDSSLLNLKGLLLYLKGELEEAISLWKINKYHNDDEIAKAYLKDIQRDFNRRDFFKEAEELIRNLNIDEALQALMICKESDYNSINVNNALAICYMRKAEYNKCQKCIDKVFSLDKYNIEAKNLKKEIDEILNIKSNGSVVIKPITITVIICIIVTSVILIRGGLQKGKDNGEDNLEIVNRNENFDVNKDIDVNNLDTNSGSINTSNEEINNDIDKKEKSNLNEHILSEDEIRQNYIKATDSFDEEKYNDTKVILESTIIYSENSHLNDDIMFLLASTYEKLGDNNEAIKKFEKYISSYENGNYIEESYYRISLLYKDLNRDKSKHYAKELISKYSNSIYNNTNIKDILNN